MAPRPTVNCATPAAPPIRQLATTPVDAAAALLHAAQPHQVRAGISLSSLVHRHAVMRRVNDTRRLQAAPADTQLLPVQGDHDQRSARVLHADKLVDFFTRVFDDRRAPPGAAARPLLPSPTAP